MKTDNLTPCMAYLAKLPPAVSGSGGHDATLTAACWCVRFGLTDAEAMHALGEYNKRCSPPWSEKELAHKLESARRKATPGEHLKNYGPPHARPQAKPVKREELRAVYEAARNRAGQPPTPPATAGQHGGRMGGAHGGQEAPPTAAECCARWQANPDDRAAQLAYVTAAIRERLPFYTADGVDLGAAGWLDWAEVGQHLQPAEA